MGDLLSRLAWWRDTDGTDELPEDYHFEGEVVFDRYEIRVQYRSGREETFDAYYAARSEHGVHYRPEPAYITHVWPKDSEMAVYDAGGRKPREHLNTEFIPYAVCAEPPVREHVATETWAYRCDVVIIGYSHASEGWYHQVANVETECIGTEAVADE